MEMKDDEEEEVYEEAVSPMGQYMSNPILSFSIIAVLELEVPLDSHFPTMTLLTDLFLPINPRFSSIMVVDKKGVKQWKRVDVILENHVKTPSFPKGKTTEFYDKCLDDYLSKIAMEQLPQKQPLWEIHIIKYPTSHAAGNLIFKLHHSLGDGFSLMGAPLSCLQRAHHPSLPLTFPSAQSSHTNVDDDHGGKSSISRVTEIFSSVCDAVSEFGSSVFGSRWIEDDVSPLRSGRLGVESLPLSISTMAFSLDHVKEIKTKLGVTVNDVITGTIFLGCRLYMESERKGSGNAKSTTLVLLNTRMFRGYKSVQEMVKPKSDLPWGNHFAFLPVPIPKLAHHHNHVDDDGDDDKDMIDPLQFVWKARKIIQKKRGSFAVFLTAKFLQLINKLRGAEAVSEYMYHTMKNSSLGITNMVGPLEQMALANHPIKGLYFVVTGAPHCMMGVVSYMGKLRVSVLVEKDFVDPCKLKACVEDAFQMIYAKSCIIK